MKKSLFVCFLALMSATTLFSQNKEVLMTVDGTPVYANEFKRVYQKNLELVQDESQKDIDGYLQLFIDYKLKVEEAKAQGLDSIKTYVSEFSKYRDQLSKQYLSEDQLSDAMIQEAYTRSKEEIKASHILVLVDYAATPQDTLAAYNKIKSIRERALTGEDFTALAKQFSEEPNAKESGGDLGYFTAFSMVYPFETEAYNTPVGKVSNIVRSQFGYHIINVVDRRKRMPKIRVSHIMVSDQKKERNFDPKERIDEIYKLLEQGESFESLAKQYSDDKSSAVKGGELKAFTKGELRAPEFENAAYSLTKIDEISKPVKTDFGWHIIKLNEILPEESFDLQKETLAKKIESVDRSRVIYQAVNKKIKDKYGFKNGESLKTFVDAYINDDLLKRRWTMDTLTNEQDKIMFSIGTKNAKYSDFGKYLVTRQKTLRANKERDAIVADFYQEFLNITLTDYFKDELEKENEGYSAILDEYRNGLLIFDVMNKNIWEKAKNDTIGLQNFYNQNKNNYAWKQRVNVDVFSATSKAKALNIQGMLKNAKSAEDIKTALNGDNTVNVLITSGTFEIDSDELPKNLKIEKGVSNVYESNDSFIVLNIKDILPSGTKALDDVKGRVMSDYQNYLEEQWISSLHNKYKVEMNSKTLKRIKKELK